MRLYQATVAVILVPLLSGCNYLFGPLPVQSSLAVNVPANVLEECGSVKWTDLDFKTIERASNPPIYTFTFKALQAGKTSLAADELEYTDQGTRNVVITMRRVGEYAYNSALSAGGTVHQPVLTCQKSGFSVSGVVSLDQVDSARTVLEVSDDGHLTANWVRLPSSN